MPEDWPLTVGAGAHKAPCSHIGYLWPSRSRRGNQHLSGRTHQPVLTSCARQKASRTKAVCSRISSIHVMLGALRRLEPFRLQQARIPWPWPLRRRFNRTVSSFCAYLVHKDRQSNKRLDAMPASSARSVGRTAPRNLRSTIAEAPSL